MARYFEAGYDPWRSIIHYPGGQRFYIHGLVMGIQYAAVGWTDHIHWLGILCLQMGLIKVPAVLQGYDFESDGN